MFNPNVRLDEVVQVVPAFAPVDMSASTGPVSDWVSLRYYRRCAVLYVAGAGTAGSDTTVTFKQATSVSGADVKDLSLSGPVRMKQGAALNAIGVTMDGTIAGATFTSDTSGESEAAWLFDVKAEDLDINGGFDCIQASVNDHGAAKVGTVLYLLYDPKQAENPLPSAIVN